MGGTRAFLYYEVQIRCTFFSFEAVLPNVGNGSFSFKLFVLLADCQRGEKLKRNQSSLNPVIEKEELMLLTRCFLFSLSNKGTG